MPRKFRDGSISGSSPAHMPNSQWRSWKSAVTGRCQPLTPLNIRGYPLVSSSHAARHHLHCQVREQIHGVTHQETEHMAKIKRILYYTAGTLFRPPPHGRNSGGEADQLQQQLHAVDIGMRKNASGLIYFGHSLVRKKSVNSRLQFRLCTLRGRVCQNKPCIRSVWVYQFAFIVHSC